MKRLINKSQVKSFRFIRDIKMRLLMHIPNRSFYNLVCYINGYSICNAERNLYDISSEFGSWYYGTKLKMHNSLHWASHIYQILAKKNDDIAINLIFDLLEEFIIQCEKNFD